MSTLVLYNGAIYTLNPRQPQASALAIKDGRILAVGDEQAVVAAAGRYAPGINLNGRAVIPGLTDAHVHLTWHGLVSQRVRLEQTSSLELACTQIAAHTATLTSGAWLLGGGWDHTNWDGQWPQRTDLDRVCPEHPAFLVRKDGHSAWVNSRALELAGIDDQTPDPPGGQIQRDERGQATGILLEAAQELVRSIIGGITPAERLAALKRAQSEGLRYGLTSVHIPPSPNPDDGRETLHDLQILRARGELRLRCLAHLAAPDFEAARSLGLRSGLGDHWLRTGGLKVFADGSLGSQTADMLEPYEGQPGTGLPMLSPAELYQLVYTARYAGISLVIHAVGDAANRKALDAIQAAHAATAALIHNDPAGNGWNAPALPDRIEHAQLVHPSDIARFAALGVVASMQPVHATADMLVADRLWGTRCATAYAWRSLLSAGAMLAFGSDAPVESFNPWHGIHAAVMRQRIDGTPAAGWYPEQRLSLTEALHGYCRGPAVASAEAHIKGMLAPGMLADLVVLAVDPFQIAPAALHTIQVDITFVDGQVQFERHL